jgi:hydroxyethylthiazole kinase-like uncharacterized protein yjeF
MKIFTCSQIKEIDEFTIRTEPVPSIDLMERAASQLFSWYVRTFDRTRKILVFTGPGNNGGDGLALARQLAMARFHVEVHNIRFSDKTSADWNINRQRLEQETTVRYVDIESTDQMPLVSQDDIVIDAIFGSGLKRPAEGLAAEAIKFINQAGCIIVSVDIPSGLFCEDNSRNIKETIVKANFTLSFQFPKLCFMFAENEQFTGEWTILPIGLSGNAIMATGSPFYYIESEDIVPLLKVRKKFDHKGNFGHGILVAGSYGKMGAAILGAKGALRTGIGLVTCHIPSSGNSIMQSALPEAMVQLDINEKIISEVPDVDRYDAVGIGPGIGTDQITQSAFHSLLLKQDRHFVIDADGINILGINRKWLSELPPKCILTPHVKEFERITDKYEDSYIRIQKQIDFAVKYNVIIVLKGACTSVATPDGKLLFNSTGNPGMATAGSGDTLTGIILSLLAQGYKPEDAAIIGVFVHGLAGDIAVGKTGYESMLASDIINNIGNAFLKLKSIELNKSDL